MAIAVDSAKFILDDTIKILRNIEEAFALIGIGYVGSVTVRYLWKVSKGIRIHFWSRLWKKDFVKQYGQWAVVTGSTDGIGKAYAKELARNGMNVMLISRSSGKLEKVAEEITSQYGVETDIVQVDFSAGREIYGCIAEHLKNREIGILVNNVGMTFTPKLFEDLSEDEIWDIIKVNVLTVPAMTKLVLPGMLERRKGAIVNISSSLAYFSVPYLQLYAATKAFVSNFSKAITAEYSSSGITVQCIEPGEVSTKISAFAETTHKSGLFNPSPDNFTTSALPTLGYSKCTTGYWIHGLQLSFLQSLPECFIIMAFKFVFEGIQKKSK